jgi:hypothetical protein
VAHGALGGKEHDPEHADGDDEHGGRGLLVGLRTALGQAWMAVVAAEIFGVPGIGARMMQASSPW